MDREERILNYNKLVEVIVDKFLSRNYRYKHLRDDLIGEGTLGLIVSIDRYDDSKGASEISYYSKGIRNYISNFITYLRKKGTPGVYIDNVPIETLASEDIEYSEPEGGDLYEKYEPVDELKRRIYEGLITGSMTQREVAEEFGITVNNVKMLKRDLIKTIRREMIRQEDMNED